MPRTSPRPGRVARLRFPLGIVLLLAYVLPVFAPPPTRPLAPPTHESSLLSWMYPDLPAWWVVGRLLALFAGAALFAALNDRPLVRAPWAERPAASPPGEPPARAWTVAALLAAALHAACLPWVSALSPAGQALYMLWLLVPGLLLIGGSRLGGRRRGPGPARPRSAPIWTVAGLIAFWLVCRTLVSYHAPRAGDAIDMWRTFGHLTTMWREGGNFLVEAPGKQLPGVNSISLFLQGSSLLRLLPDPPTLLWVQTAHALWLAVCAGVLALLTGHAVGRAAAPVAVAAFLFSPYLLVAQLTPTPYALASAFMAFLLLTATTFVRTGSLPALAFLGSAAGIAVANPATAPATALVVLMVAWRWRHGRHLPPAVTLTAGLTLVAILATSVPGPATIQALAAQYSAPRVPWASAELVLAGQVAPVIPDTFVGLEGPAVATVAGALLAPFVARRTMLRQWGDTVLEPIAAALVAVGLAVCLRHARASPASLGLLLLFGATIAPAFISSYDRPSLLRAHGAPLPLALLAAVGFAAVRTAGPWRGARRRAGLATAVAIGASGLLLFDVVTPRLLRASSVGLVARAIAHGEPGTIAMLTAYRFREGVSVEKHLSVDWLLNSHDYLPQILRAGPRRPVSTVFVEALERGDADAARDTLFWTPALEYTAGLADRLCALWPAAAVYTIEDGAGLSRVHALRPRGDDWQPAVRPDRWRMTPCAAREDLA
jgi:hypothetical protein